ncbi:hypothetical protein IE53DRAFT_151735 [Violaceomyces palustris]|uniref:Uncharacterized protein n=1 Tax=Violaceomyces palustris TaxID=1673888 RepID=A0ACD0NUG5_9BASI|nr:hypothetical protein IE53DRAFT_151735 [Violaceomyces palustris]
MYCMYIHYFSLVPLLGLTLSQSFPTKVWLDHLRSSHPLPLFARTGDGSDHSKKENISSKKKCKKRLDSDVRPKASPSPLDREMNLILPSVPFLFDLSTCPVYLNPQPPHLPLP